MRTVDLSPEELESWYGYSYSGVSAMLTRNNPPWPSKDQTGLFISLVTEPRYPREAPCPLGGQVPEALGLCVFPDHCLGHPVRLRSSLHTQNPCPDDHTKFYPINAWVPPGGHCFARKEAVALRRLFGGFVCMLRLEIPLLHGPYRRDLEQMNAFPGGVRVPTLEGALPYWPWELPTS